jgi:hypothetical protein
MYTSRAQNTPNSIFTEQCDRFHITPLLHRPFTQTPARRGLPSLQIMYISGKQEPNLRETFIEKKRKKIIPSSIQPFSNPSASV